MPIARATASAPTSLAVAAPTPSCPLALFPAPVETYYCSRQAVGDDLVFEVEVTDPEDNQRDVAKED